MFQKKSRLTDAQIDLKAREMVDKLSLKEKVWLLHGNWQMIRDGILYKRTYNPVPIETYGSRKIGLKPVGFTDGPRGVVMGKSTAFPVSMARAASFDPELEERIGEAIGKEARAGKANYFAGVCINLLMHPAGGRAQESYGEDPYLVGEMGAALVRGVQKHNVMACVKHYAVNNMENKRFSVNVNCSERTLREVYLPHFKKTIDAGAASIMGSYNKFRGEQASESKHLLTDILRDDWGFEGFAITDFIFALRDGAKAIRSGMDVEMPVPVHFGNELLQALKDGKITEADIDRALLRRIRTQLVFENSKDPLTKYGKELIACEKHYALACEAAEKSMVLIKNEGNVLPLSKDIRKIALLGKLANTENTGDHGSSRVYSERIITALEGLKKYLGESVEVIFDEGNDLDKVRKIAEEADAVLVVAGNDYNDEGESVMPDPDSDVNPLECMAQGFINNNHKLIGNGMKKGAAKSGGSMDSYTGDDVAVGGDRKSLRLRDNEIAMIKAAGQVNPKTIVSLVCGSMIMTADWEDSAAAILYSFYSGVEGGRALARILFGTVNPSGKLPFTIPTTEEHLPQVDFMTTEITYDFYHGYRKLDHDGNKAAYPFGYGLSYTTFSYGQPKVKATESGYVIEVDITNTGNRDGAEAAQVYVSMPNSKVERHVKKLCAFKKTEIKAGQTKHVTIPVSEEELKYFDEEQNAFVLEDTEYVFAVGKNLYELQIAK